MTSINFVSSEKCPLSYLCIFNPSLGISEGSLHNQILFFISETYLSLNDQQRNIGLIQGIMEFSLNFRKKVSNEYIQSKNHVIIVKEVENGWYIAASFFSKFLRKNNIFFPPFTVLFNYLCQAYEQYRLLYGLLNYTLQKDGRKVLESQLNEWWQRWVGNLDVTLNDPSILYSAINMGFITPDFKLKEKINKNMNDLKASNERIIDLIILSVSPIFNYHKHNEGCLYSGDGTISRNTIKILHKWLEYQIKELISKVDIKEKNNQDNFKNNQDKKKKNTSSASDSRVEFNNNSNSSISLLKSSNFFTLSSISANISSYISSIFSRNNLDSASKKQPCSYNCSENSNIFFKYNSTLGNFIYGFIEKHNSDSTLSEKELYIGDNQINQHVNSALNNPKSTIDLDLKALNLDYESNPRYISVSVYYSYPLVYLIALKSQNINTENSEKVFIRNKIFYTNLQCCLEKITVDIETYFAESFENSNSFFWHIIFDPNTQELYTNVPYSKENDEENYSQIEKILSTEDVLHIHSHALSIFDKIKNSKNGNKINDYILKTSKNFWVCYLHVKEKHIILFLKKNQYKGNIIHTTIENIFQEARKYVSKLFNLSDTPI
ncbi:hypothetical protein MERGE_002189 [Pneumocystis wakefieldiae]|uniref:CCZ1/INTU/HSP4 first Longin domain-containing protein n=1 Tax=Pneumocystis wakefieldiae TaxID=38082 RepID=A0A899FX71_9ASCO|nr:hypothetical protein MERGE_002189 [Pneumocystis wakefieldiae]